MIDPRRAGKTGKLPPDPTRQHLRLSAHLTGATPTPPPSADWLTKVPSWPMYANDQLGDCVWAMIGHALQSWTAYAGQQVTVTTSALLKGYSDVTGYRPGHPETDQGTNVQDALDYWRKTGIVGPDGVRHRILAFAKVNHRDRAEVDTALALFGALLIGFEFPRVAMSQFSAGKPWDVVPDDGGIESGHAIHGGAYLTSAARSKHVTWGAVQDMTDRFWDRYVDEAWIAITPEWVAANGLSPSGLDLHGLGATLAVITDSPDPFPGPPPGPTPPPAPIPEPPAPVADPDAAPWVTARPWLDHPRAASHLKAMIDAVKAWGKAKGFTSS